MEIVGILLAAGRGTRFDPSAQALKLLQPGPWAAAPAQPLAAAAARNLCTALDAVVAVVRDDEGPQQQALRELLAAAGCRIVRCRPAPGQPEGTGTSIACGIAACRDAAGWIIALADMPDIRPATVAAVRAAIAWGATSAAPYFRGQRGHPVGFAAACGPALSQLRGDAGARSVLERHRPVRIPVEDPGILLDIDLPGDLEAAGRQPRL